MEEMDIFRLEAIVLELAFRLLLQPTNGFSMSIRDNLADSFQVSRMDAKTQ